MFLILIIFCTLLKAEDKSFIDVTSLKPTLNPFLKNESKNIVDVGNGFDPEKEINFSADKTEYNYETSSVSAYGNVVISQPDILIKADSLYYDKSNKWLFLSGNVYLFDKKMNQEIFLDDVYLIGSMANIIGTNIGTVFANDTTIRGKYFVKKDNKLDIYKPSFTSCPIFNDTTPLWELKAGKMNYNKEEDKLTVYNGALSIKGVPIFWSPYMYYSGGKNQRTTGFLTPKVGSVNNTTYIENNLFINVSESQNIYLKHRLHGKLNYDNLSQMVDLSDMKNLLQYDHYGYIKDGKFKIKTGILDEKQGEDKTYFLGSIQHPINDFLRAEANITYLSENKFAREYNLKDVIETEERFANSFLKLEAITEKLYVSFNGSSSYNVKTDQRTQDPSIQSLYFVDMKNYGNLSGRSDFYYIKELNNDKEEGVLGNEIDYNKSIITKGGVLTAALGVRSTNTATKEVGKESEQDYYAGSMSTLTWEMPFSRSYRNGFISISPLLGVFKTDFLSDSGKAWDSEIKAKTIDSFFSNRYFYTWDSFSEQKGINYGIRGNITSDNYNGNLFVGLSQEFANHSNDTSNFLLNSLGFNIKENFQLYYQGSYQIETQQFTESYLSIKFYNKIFSLESSYILGSYDTNVERNDEILSKLTFKATENINIYTSNLIGIDYINNTTYNKSFLKEFEIGVLWKNNCLALGTIVEVTKYNIGEEELDMSASIFIEFRGIGQIKTDGDDFDNKIFRH